MIELCGLLSTNKIERSEFDALYMVGVKKVSGAREYGNPDTTLGKQAGATLARNLDHIYRTWGLAILKKRPMAKYECGGNWDGIPIPPHADYPLLKRARLTKEFDPPN